MISETTESNQEERRIDPLKDYHVTPEELVEDMRAAFEDVFAATYEEKGRTLLIKFSNGQTFRCVVGEVVQSWGKPIDDSDY